MDIKVEITVDVVCPKLAEMSLVPDDVVGGTNSPESGNHTQQGVGPCPYPFFVFQHDTFLRSVRVRGKNNKEQRDKGQRDVPIPVFSV